MFELFTTKVLPINFIFFLGYFLKRKGLMKAEDGGVLLKLVFYLFLPSVLFMSVKDTTLSTDVVLYPLLVMSIQFFMYFIGLAIYNHFKLPPKQKPIIIGALMIMNNSFVLPFFISFFGEGEVWRIGFLDFGNVFLNFTFIYGLFINSKEGSLPIRHKLKKILTTPPLIALFLGIIVGQLDLHIPIGVELLLDRLGSMTGNAVMLALGLYFTTKMERKSLVIFITFAKFFFGFIIATIICYIFSFEGVGRTSVYLVACSPVGMNLLTFSLLTDSDIELASSIVSFSVLLNLFLIPLLIIFL